MNWQTAAQRIRRKITAPGIQLGAAMLATAAIGGWLGLLVGGTVSAPVGPVETRMTVRPSLYGNTQVDVAPLGDLRFDSHDGPLQLDVSIKRLNPTDAESIVNNPSSIDQLPAQVEADLRAGLRRLVAKSALFAITGALLAGLVIWRRRWRRALLTSAVGAGLVAAGLGLAALTWNPRSVSEPRYTGLLANAPKVIGDAQSIVTDFGKYGDELARLVTNVSRLYAVGMSLPVEPDPDTVRVLFVADIHLNPAAWNVIRSLIAQHQIAFVIDAGDLTDHGSTPENPFIDAIGTLGVPYIFVRGNHDSVSTEAAVREQPNAQVLAGEVIDVGGIRIIGAGDPRFTPNRLEEPDVEAVTRVGQNLARTAYMASPAIHIAVFHDPTAVRELDGIVPLLLAGHVHRRSSEILEHGSRLFIQGSTGGAGLRGIESDGDPTPIMCTILYLDRTTKTLKAWDDITLGGLGETSATISRHTADQADSPDIGTPDDQGAEGSGTDRVPPPPARLLRDLV